MKFLIRHVRKVIKNIFREGEGTPISRATCNMSGRNNCHLKDADSSFKIN